MAKAVVVVVQGPSLLGPQGGFHPPGAPPVPLCPPPSTRGLLLIMASNLDHFRHMFLSCCAAFHATMSSFTSLKGNALPAEKEERRAFALNDSMCSAAGLCERRVMSRWAASEEGRFAPGPTAARGEAPLKVQKTLLGDQPSMAAANSGFKCSEEEVFCYDEKALRSLSLVTTCMTLQHCWQTLL
ncbi:hypothetical protein AOLI_G00306660 [Acnodon oligacanthus]